MHSIMLSLLQYVPERFGLRMAKSGLSGTAEDLSNAGAFEFFDRLIKVCESAFEVAREFFADSGLTCAHKSDQAH
jgi:hypothetical protein